MPQRPGCYRDQSDDELRVLRQGAEPQPHHVANPVGMPRVTPSCSAAASSSTRNGRPALRVSSRRMDWRAQLDPEPAHQVGDLLTGQWRHRDVVVRGPAQLLEGLATTGLVRQLLAAVGDDHEQRQALTALGQVAQQLEVDWSAHCASSTASTTGRSSASRATTADTTSNTCGAAERARHVGRRQLGQQHVQVPPGATEE